jgi:bifunctional ADP-heptose synthase (sugar kinase/adenylyltransferase)
MSDASTQSEKPPTNPDPPGSQPVPGMALARKFQAKAAARSDPLAANLGVIMANLMMVAHTMGAAMQEWLSDAESASAALQQNERTTDTYLKVVRQIDRMARIDQQMAPPTEEESVAQRPRPSTRWRE